MKRHNAVASETLTVTDYRGHRQTLLPVREINLKACRPIIVKQFIQPSCRDWTQARLITVSDSARTVPMSHMETNLWHLAYDVLSVYRAVWVWYSCWWFSASVGHRSQPFTVSCMVSSLLFSVTYFPWSSLASRSGVATGCGGCGPHRAALARGGIGAKNAKN